MAAPIESPTFVDQEFHNHNLCPKTKSVSSLKRLAKKLAKFEKVLVLKEDITITNNKTQILCVQNGGLGNNVSQEELLPIFEKFGHVDCVMMIPQKSFSFVCFNDTAHAAKACETLNGFLLRRGKDPTQDVILYIFFVEKAPPSIMPSYEKPPGLIIVEDFVTEELEKSLIDLMDSESGCMTQEPNMMKHRRVKHYGYEFKYSINDVDISEPLPGGIPEICHEFLRQAVEQELVKHFPDQLTINSYQPGQGIPPHVDTREAFEDGIMSLSLGSQVVMDFRHPNGNHLCVLLPRRSLVVMSGESRYIWSHGITPRKSDIVSVTKASNLKNNSSKDGGPVNSLCSNESIDGEGDCVDISSVVEPVKESTSHSLDTSVPKQTLQCCNDDQENQSLTSRPSLTLQARERRVSFTFRKVVMDRSKRNSMCVNGCEKECSVPDNMSIPCTDDEAVILERQHVHKVYDDIADHFSGTRYKPWPRVVDFLMEQPPLSLLADVGCGNGKCLGVNKDLFEIGSDFSSNLASICHSRGFETCVGDVTCLPFRTGTFDVVLCIAVIHHMATRNRRLEALCEVVRILHVGGHALVYVWAMEQERNKSHSKYIKPGRQKKMNDSNYNGEAEVVSQDSRSTHGDLINADMSVSGSSCHGDGNLMNKSGCCDVYNNNKEGGNDVDENIGANSISIRHTEETDSDCKDGHCESDNPTKDESDEQELKQVRQLQVHVNRTEFKDQDVLVPWQLKNKSGTSCNSRSDDADVGDTKETLFHRFYHVFRQGELEALCKRVPNCCVKKSYYDQGNWCVVLEKL